MILKMMKTGIKMAKLNHKTINELAETFQLLSRKRPRTLQKKLQIIQEKNAIFQQLFFLIKNATYRYQQFANYTDLQQEGQEGLIRALLTYDQKQGNFKTWAEYYISTRIFRSANAHSVIKIPIKQARKLKPHKVSQIPKMFDSWNVEAEVENCETREYLNEAISELPGLHQEVVKLFFGYDGIAPHSITAVLETLKINRKQFIEIMDQVKLQLKNSLINKGVDGNEVYNFA